MQRSFPFFFLSLWRLMRPKRTVRSFPFVLKKGKECKESNATFFCKERKRMERMERSFEKKGKERKERNVLLKRTERTERSFEKNGKERKRSERSERKRTRCPTLQKNIINRVGHHILFRAECLVLFRSFKGCNVLFHSFF